MKKQEQTTEERLNSKEAKIQERKTNRKPFVIDDQLIMSAKAVEHLFQEK